MKAPTLDPLTVVVRATTTIVPPTRAMRTPLLSTMIAGTTTRTHDANTVAVQAEHVKTRRQNKDEPVVAIEPIQPAVSYAKVEAIKVIK
jgi:hypothetical protein